MSGDRLRRTRWIEDQHRGKDTNEMNDDKDDELIARWAETHSLISALNEPEDNNWIVTTLKEVRNVLKK